MKWEIKNFQPKEVLSPSGLKQLRRNNLLLDLASLKKYDLFRDYIDARLICNYGNLRLRGYRSPIENGLYQASKVRRAIRHIVIELAKKRQEDFLKEVRKHVPYYVQGADYSRHVQGKAFDTHSPDMPLRELFFKALDFGWPAVGIYPEKGFLHLDNRDLVEKDDGKQYTIVWNGETKGRVYEFSGDLTDKVLDDLKEHIL